MWRSSPNRKAKTQVLKHRKKRPATKLLVAEIVEEASVAKDGHMIFFGIVIATNKRKKRIFVAYEVCNPPRWRKRVVYSLFSVISIQITKRDGSESFWKVEMPMPDLGAVVVVETNNKVYFNTIPMP